MAFSQIDGASAPTLGVGHPYQLTSTQGDTVTDKTYQGFVQVVLFGYTWCPDVCPASLGTLSRAMNGLGADRRTIKVVFISVDPERDQPKLLRRYLDNFGHDFVGLTGAPAALAQTARAFHTAYEIIGSGEDHTVSHSGLIYVFDRAGRLAKVFHPAAESNAIAVELKSLVVQGISGGAGGVSSAVSANR